MAAATSDPGLNRSLDLGSQNLDCQSRRHLSPLVTSQPVGNREEVAFNQHRVFVLFSTSTFIGNLCRFQPDHQSSMMVVPPLCGGL